MCRQKEIWNQTCDARRYQVMNKVLRKLIQKGAAGGSHLHNVWYTHCVYDWKIFPLKSFWSLKMSIMCKLLMWICAAFRLSNYFLPQALKARGYERLVLQVGRGSVLPAADSCPHIRLEAFRFKNSIAEDISQADLIISHAGRAIRCPTQLMHSRPTHGDSLFHFYYL